MKVTFLKDSDVIIKVYSFIFWNNLLLLIGQKYYGDRVDLKTQLLNNTLFSL